MLALDLIEEKSPSSVYRKQIWEKYCSQAQSSKQISNSQVKVSRYKSGNEDINVRE